jgi:hypothetical protein
LAPVEPAEIRHSPQRHYVDGLWISEDLAGLLEAHLMLVEQSSPAR